MTVAGIFAEWQPRYAAHQVATFPVGIDKKPAISGYTKAGLGASAQLAIRFADARSFGFMCGARNRVTVVDMDDSDPAIVKEGERLFGPSPLLWRTGGGKFAMVYRHNGEARRIRPIPSLPIDLLGGGFAVAPPSAGAIHPYEIIRGTLADLDRLPIARMPEEVAQLDTRPIPKGRRNNELFKHCRAIVGYCDDVDQLIDAARTWADDRLALPLPQAEIVKTCASVWNYRGGRKRVMNQIVEAPQYRALLNNSNALAVFVYLSAEKDPAGEFMIADGLGKAMGWPTRRVPEARKALLDLGLIECVRRRGNGVAALYRWRQPQEADLANPLGKPYFTPPPSCEGAEADGIAPADGADPGDGR